jgi:hypothetical protein
MKKLFAIFMASAILLAISFNASAQISLKAGYASNKFTAKLNSVSTSTTLDGLYLGAGYSFPLNVDMEGFSINPSLLYEFFGNNETTMHYFQVPVYCSYTYTLNETIGFFGEAGPSLALGLGGKYEISDNTKVDVFSDDELQRFNILFGFNTGVILKSTWKFSFGFDWGLININNASDDTKIHNRIFHIGAAYLF